MKQFGKILKFELKGYLKNKIFIGVTIFLIIAIAVVSFLPNIISAIKDDDATVKEDLPVMLIHSQDENFSKWIQSSFEEVFPDYNVTISTQNEEEIKELVITGEADCAFVMESATSYTYYVNNLSMYDVNEQTASAVLQELYRTNAFLEQSNLPPETVLEIMSTQINSTTTALGKSQMDNFFYTYIMIFALYMVILLYGQMVATGVATEKSSRAMEVLITSAKPTSMMFGKVLAACIAGFSQLVAVFGSAILFYNINKDSLTNPLISSIFNIPIDLFIFMIVFFLLGFLIYAFLFGAVGSTASKLEDINTSVMPITYIFIIAFLIVVFSMTNGNVDNIVMKICSYIPFTSPMAMFTRIAMSSVAWYEIAISILILIASVFGVGVLSARIYRVGVLLYGNPPKFKNIIKMTFTKK